MELQTALAVTGTIFGVGSMFFRFARKDVRMGWRFGLAAIIFGLAALLIIAVGG